MKEDKLAIWFSNQCGQYKINLVREIKAGTCNYEEGRDNILYIMKSSQVRLAKKIMNSLNSVRQLA